MKGGFLGVYLKQGGLWAGLFYFERRERKLEGVLL